MLGNGCPWKGQCRVNADRYHKKNYCDSDSGCYHCPHRPMNDGNKNVQRQYDSRKSSNSTVNMFWFIVAGLAVIWFFFGR